MLEKSLGHGSGDSTSCAALFLIYFFPRRPCLSTISKVAFAVKKSKKSQRGRVITRGEVGCSTLQGKDNAISDVSRDNGAFVPHLSSRDSSVYD